jgi:uncharacterized protein (UPF0332 family)
MNVFTQNKNDTTVMILWDIMTEVLGNIAEKLTTITVLGLFLNYFMRELKAVQRLRESDKRESNKRFEAIFERQIEIEKENIESTIRQCDYNAQLTDAINKLRNHIDKM